MCEVQRPRCPAEMWREMNQQLHQSTYLAASRTDSGHLWPGSGLDGALSRAMLQQHSCACTAWKCKVWRGGGGPGGFGTNCAAEAGAGLLAGCCGSSVFKFEGGACNGSKSLDCVRICLAGELFSQFKDGQTSNITLINSLPIRGEHGH